MRRESLKLSTTENLGQANILCLIISIEMCAGDDTPEVLRLQVAVIPVLDKQTIDSIPFFKGDLNIVVWFRGFFSQEFFDFFNIHNCLIYFLSYQPRWL